MHVKIAILHCPPKVYTKERDASTFKLTIDLKAAGHHPTYFAKAFMWTFQPRVIQMQNIYNFFCPAPLLPQN